MILSLQVRSSLPSEKCFGEASIFFWSLFEGEQPIVQRTRSLGRQRQRQKNTNKFNRKCFKDVFLETRGFKDLEYDIGYHQDKDKVLWTPNVCYIIPDTTWSAIFKNHESWQISRPCEPRGHPMTYPPTSPLLAQGSLKRILVKLKPISTVRVITWVVWGEASLVERCLPLVKLGTIPKINRSCWYLGGWCSI